MRLQGVTSKGKYLHLLKIDSYGRLLTCWLNQNVLFQTKQSELLKEMTKMPVISILTYQNSTCVKWEIETVKCNVLCSFSAYGALVLNLSRQFHNFSLDRTSQFFIHFVSAFQSNRVTTILWLLWLWIHKKCFPCNE